MYPKNYSRKIISICVLASFLLNTILPSSFVHAQSLPGSTVSLSPAFEPLVVKGLRLFSDNPLRFDFIVDKGQSGLKDDTLKVESTKLIKYFLAALTVPEDDLWVNLSPHEKDRIIPNQFGVTEMGRDMLAQDYLLKQLSSSLTSPENELGKKFWEKVYAQAGSTDIPTFNPPHRFAVGEASPTLEGWAGKVWIVPDKAVVYENGDKAFVVEAKLRVKLQNDIPPPDPSGAWGRLGGGEAKGPPLPNPPHSLRLGEGNISTNLIKEIILPAIEKEVNEGQNFANLRQIYYSLILATWFKKNLRKSFLGEVYLDQNKTNGVEIEDRQAKEKIYQQYLEALKKGAYDTIKEEYDPETQQVIPRKYFAGGLKFGAEMNHAMVVTHDGASLNHVDQTDLAMVSSGLKLASAQEEKKNETLDRRSSDPGSEDAAQLSAVAQERIGAIEQILFGGKFKITVPSDDDGRRRINNSFEKGKPGDGILHFLAEDKLMAELLDRDYWKERIGNDLYGGLALIKGINDLPQDSLKIALEIMGQDNFLGKDLLKKVLRAENGAFLIIPSFKDTDYFKDMNEIKIIIDQLGMETFLADVLRNPGSFYYITQSLFLSKGIIGRLLGAVKKEDSPITLEQIQKVFQTHPLYFVDGTFIFDGIGVDRFLEILKAKEVSSLVPLFLNLWNSDDILLFEGFVNILTGEEREKIILYDALGFLGEVSAQDSALSLFNRVMSQDRSEFAPMARQAKAYIEKVEREGGIKMDDPDQARKTLLRLVVSVLLVMRQDLFWEWPQDKFADVFLRIVTGQSYGVRMKEGVEADTNFVFGKDLILDSSARHLEGIVAHEIGHYEMIALARGSKEIKMLGEFGADITALAHLQSQYGNEAALSYANGAFFETQDDIHLKARTKIQDWIKAANGRPIDWQDMWRRFQEKLNLANKSKQLNESFKFDEFVADLAPTDAAMMSEDQLVGLADKHFSKLRISDRGLSRKNKIILGRLLDEQDQGERRLLVPEEVAPLLKEWLDKSQKRVLMDEYYQSPESHGDRVIRSGTLAALVKEYGDNVSLTIRTPVPSLYNQQNPKTNSFGYRKDGRNVIENLLSENTYDLTLLYLPPLEIEKDPQTIWVDTEWTQFGVESIHFLGLELKFEMPSPNHYERRQVIARALGLDPDAVAPELYVNPNPESPVHHQVRMWLQQRGLLLSRAERQQQKRPLIVLGAIGGSNIGKGFSDMDKVSGLITMAVRQNNADILFNQNRRFTAEMREKLERDFPEDVKKRVYFLPYVEDKGKEEWMKYFIYLADAVLTVEGGNVHTAWALGTSVVSMEFALKSSDSGHFTAATLGIFKYTPRPFDQKRYQKYQMDFFVENKEFLFEDDYRDKVMFFNQMTEPQMAEAVGVLKNILSKNGFSFSDDAAMMSGQKIKSAANEGAIKEFYQTASAGDRLDISGYLRESALKAGQNLLNFPLPNGNRWGKVQSLNVGRKLSRVEMMVMERDANGQIARVQFTGYRVGKDGQEVETRKSEWESTADGLVLDDSNEYEEALKQIYRGENKGILDISKYFGKPALAAGQFLRDFILPNGKWIREKKSFGLGVGLSRIGVQGLEWGEDGGVETIQFMGYKTRKDVGEILYSRSVWRWTGEKLELKSKTNIENKGGEIVPALEAKAGAEAGIEEALKDKAMVARDRDRAMMGRRNFNKGVIAGLGAIAATTAGKVALDALAGDKKGESSRAEPVVTATAAAVPLTPGVTWNREGDKAVKVRYVSSMTPDGGQPLVVEQIWNLDETMIDSAAEFFGQVLDMDESTANVDALLKILDEIFTICYLVKVRNIQDGKLQSEIRQNLFKDPQAAGIFLALAAKLTDTAKEKGYYIFFNHQRLEANSLFKDVRMFEGKGNLAAFKGETKKDRRGQDYVVIKGLTGPRGTDLPMSYSSVDGSHLFIFEDNIAQEAGHLADLRKVTPTEVGAERLAELEKEKAEVEAEIARLKEKKEETSFVFFGRKFVIVELPTDETATTAFTITTPDGDRRYISFRQLLLPSVDTSTSTIEEDIKIKADESIPLEGRAQERKNDEDLRTSEGKLANIQAQIDWIQDGNHSDMIPYRLLQEALMGKRDDEIASFLTNIILAREHNRLERAKKRLEKVQSRIGKEKDSQVYQILWQWSHDVQGLDKILADLSGIKDTPTLLFTLYQSSVPYEFSRGYQIALLGMLGNFRKFETVSDIYNENIAEGKAAYSEMWFKGIMTREDLKLVRDPYHESQGQRELNEDSINLFWNNLKEAGYVHVENGFDVGYVDRDLVELTQQVEAPFNNAVFLKHVEYGRRATTDLLLSIIAASPQTWLLRQVENASGGDLQRTQQYDELHASAVDLYTTLSKLGDDSLAASLNNSVDPAMMGKEFTKGGIDFSAIGGSASGGNPNKFNLETQGQGINIPPFDPAQFEGVTIDGFTPVIFSITPITNLPLILGVTEETPSQEKT